MHIYYDYLYGHTHIHRGHEIYNLGRPFLVYYYYTLSLSDLCPVWKKNH